jgi:hypothetical protein
MYVLAEPPLMDQLDALVRRAERDVAFEAVRTEAALISRRERLSGRDAWQIARWDQKNLL